MVTNLVKTSSLIVLIAWGCLGSAQGNIEGLWWSPKKDSKIQIFKREQKYFGKIVWITPEKAEFKDTRNPEEQLKNRPILGLEILTDFISTDGEHFTSGRVYDPESGTTYRCKMTLIEDDVLKVRGYVGISLLGRTEKFTRVTEAL